MRHILYHANCCDGFASAYIAWSRYGDADTQYHPVSYGQPVPGEIMPGDDVLILDFSYPRETLLALNDKLNSLLVLDHHKTAEQDLAGLSFCHFDNTQCGCLLTWQHIYGSLTPPTALRLIDARDRGEAWNPGYDPAQKKFVFDFYAGLWLGTERTFDAWANCFPSSPNESIINTSVFMDKLLTTGAAINRAMQISVEQACEGAFMIALPRQISADTLYHHVPCVLSPLYQSEIGHHLLHTHGSLFAVIVRTAGRSIEVSLRSRDVGSAPTFDCGAYARQFGGGGHYSAAGFSASLHDLHTWIL